MQEAGRGGIKPSRCGESKRRRWSVVSMGSGMVTEECSGASRPCTVVRREKWWRRCGERRSYSWSGESGGVGEWVVSCSGGVIEGRGDGGR